MLCFPRPEAQHSKDLKSIYETATQKQPIFMIDEWRRGIRGALSGSDLSVMKHQSCSDLLQLQGEIC